MRPGRAWISRILLAVAVATTLTFLLSTLFLFGAATHRSTTLSWNASTSGYGLVQARCGRGQFHLVIDFAPPGGRPGRTLVPRAWYAGARWAPGVRTDLRKTSRWISKIGIDAFLNHGTYFSAGVFGLYPTVLAWLVVWLHVRGRIAGEGRCTACGYDLRATPERCPECGKVPAPVGGLRRAPSSQPQPR